MAIEVIQTEFPNTELVQAFSLFLLADEKGQFQERDDAALSRYLCRIAQFVDVDTNLFRTQFWDVQPLARAIFKDTSGISHLRAWQLALTRRGRRGSVHEHPTEELLKGLALYAAFHSCTTSDTERSFSTQSRLLTPQRDHMTIGTEHDEMSRMWGFDSSEKADIIANVQKIYVAAFGTARKSCLDRQDKGVPKSRQPGTLQGWRSSQAKRLVGMMADAAPLCMASVKT